MRTSDIQRKTAETDVRLRLCLDGAGESEIDTGVGFLDHMLTLFALHGGFDLRIFCRGDLQVDAHHTTEDVGICLGDAFAAALGDRRGICRYGTFILPMDEALVLVSADISGRACLRYSVPVPSQKVGNFDTELVEEFLQGFVRRAGITLHVRRLDGTNTHHILEAVFKCLGHALAAAVAPAPSGANTLLSTKGLL